MSHNLAHTNWGTMESVLRVLHNTSTTEQKVAAWNANIKTTLKLLAKKDKDSVFIRLCNYASAFQLQLPPTLYLLKQCCKFHAPLCLGHILRSFPTQLISWRNKHRQSLLHLLTNHINFSADDTLKCINLLKNFIGFGSLVTVGDTDGATPIDYLITEQGDNGNYWGSLPIDSYHRENRTAILYALLDLCNYEYPINQPIFARPDTMLHYAVRHGLYEALTALAQIEGCDLQIPLYATNPITPLRAAIERMANFTGHHRHPPPGLGICA